MAGDAGPDRASRAGRAAARPAQAAALHPATPPVGLEWRIPNDGVETIRTLETHAAGEPLRIVVGGVPPVPGATMLEKRRWARTHLDDVRKALILEPRGHRDMYGAILTEPVTADGDLGVLFLHNEGFSTMCGHGVIALCAALRRTGRVPPDVAVLRLDTPAGRVDASFPDVSTEGPIRVAFRNVASFALALDLVTELGGVGRIAYDIAFGGGFYALVDAGTIGIPLRPEHASDLARVGRTLRDTIAAEQPIVHPAADDLGYLYGVIFVGPPEDPRHHSRNVCVFGDGEVDRSPTGTGVSARAALHHARGEITLGQPFTVESILGTTFTATALEEAAVGGLPAVIPRVEGTGHIIGRAEYGLDPRDPVGAGVLLR